MVTITLSNQEVEIIKKSINHCMKTCKEGGAHEDCPECQSLRDILNKLL